MYFLSFTNKNNREVYWSGSALTFNQANRKEYKEHHHAEAALRQLKKSTAYPDYQNLKIDW